MPFEAKSETEIREIFNETINIECKNVTIKSTKDSESFGLVYMEGSAECLLEPQNGDADFCRNGSTRTSRRMCNCKSPG